MTHSFVLLLDRTYRCHLEIKCEGGSRNSRKMEGIESAITYTVTRTNLIVVDEKLSYKEHKQADYQIVII
jgi:hypothetical protein